LSESRINLHSPHSLDKMIDRETDRLKGDYTF
jgi:hypothetical protein